MSLFERILVPTDFSDAATKALDYAVEMAKPFGARITLLHVCPITVVSIPDGALVSSADMVAGMMTSAQESLDAILAARKGCGIAIEGMVVTGDPRETILATARQVDAGLVVMGTHGRRGLAHWLLGSVAEFVVRKAHVPVITVRDAGAAKEESPLAHATDANRGGESSVAGNLRPTQGLR